MQTALVLLNVINLLLIAGWLYTDYLHRKERRCYLDFIDRLQNKLMARDFTEYTNQTRQTGDKKVTNPLMNNIRNNLRERSQLPELDDDERT